MSVDIIMMTYNHQEYIVKAIEGVLCQTTTFPFRLIIGEDKSTDNTLEICQKYATQNPNKILLLKREKNMGVYDNFVDIYNHCSAKYIALCEGDDYWTDPLKLQKQVDFLENNQDYVICFHSAKEIRSNGEVKISNENQKNPTDISDLVQGWYINTATYVFRNSKKIVFPDWYYKVMATDLCFHILIAENGGKIHFINETMSVYRRHDGGITNEMNSYLFSLKKNIGFYDLLIRYFEKKNSPYTNQSKARKKDIENKLFYQFLYAKNKTFNDYILIAKMGFKLRKFGSLKLFR